MSSLKDVGLKDVSLKDVVVPDLLDFLQASQVSKQARMFKM